MKVLIATLNSKFIHSNLAIRYLQEVTRDLAEVEIKEYTINQPLDYIIGDIYKEKPDLLDLSTYIWNVNEVLRISEAIKKVLPDTTIVLGGPEVSYDSRDVLEKNPYIDMVVFGEGEETFRELVDSLKNKSSKLEDIKGLAYRKSGQVFVNQPRPLICNLDKIPSPYTQVSKEFENKIVYYESSRGCPFNCKFCLSSTIKGVRYFSLDRVKRDLDVLIDSKVSQVKFVDRTFNANRKFSMEILNHIIDRDPKNMNFHFEVTAHLLDRETLDFLKGVKEGLFQLEVGVQSTNEKTIKAIGRTTDFPKLREVTKEIKSFKNIHQHLDLIAGLPYEGYESFKKSFNDIYEIRPEQIQLGFLKLLKGSELRDLEEKYGYEYIDSPPYEVLKSNYISYGEIVELKLVEDLVEKYYNEGNFKNSLEFILANHFLDPFSFFEDLGKYWTDKGYNHMSLSKKRLYDVLLAYYLERDFSYKKVFKDLLRYDFIKNNKNAPLSQNLKPKIQVENKDIHRILKNERILENYLSEYKDLPTKRLIRKATVERFDLDIMELIERGYLFDESLMSEEYVLFSYTDGVITPCRTYLITEIIKEMN